MSKDNTQNREVEPEREEKIEMLDALGYLYNGCLAWTFVPKGSSLSSSEDVLSDIHLLCENELDGKSHLVEYLSSKLVKKLRYAGYVKCRIEPDYSNAGNDRLFCELEDEGKAWYLKERTAFREFLHHTLK